MKRRKHECWSPERNVGGTRPLERPDRPFPASSHARNHSTKSGQAERHPTRGESPVDAARTPYAHTRGLLRTTHRPRSRRCTNCSAIEWTLPSSTHSRQATSARKDRSHFTHARAEPNHESTMTPRPRPAMQSSPRDSGCAQGASADPFNGYLILLTDIGQSQRRTKASCDRRPFASLPPDPELYRAATCVQSVIEDNPPTDRSRSGRHESGRRKAGTGERAPGATRTMKRHA